MDGHVDAAVISDLVDNTSSQQMMSKRVHLVFAALLVWSSATAATEIMATPPGARGSLRVHPANPRYFADGTTNSASSLRAIYLTGSHTWPNLQDGGHADPPAAFDYCLANPGREYVVFQTGDGAFTVDLSAAAGEMHLEWIHPVEGNVTRAEAVAGGMTRTLKAPFPGLAVAHLSSTSPAANAAPKPNIVFLLADDLGYGDLGCYSGRARRQRIHRNLRLARRTLASNRLRPGPLPRRDANNRPYDDRALAGAAWFEARAGTWNLRKL